MNKTSIRWIVIAVLSAVIMTYVFLTTYSLLETSWMWGYEASQEQLFFEDQAPVPSVLSSTGSLFKAHVIRNLAKTELDWKLHTSSNFYQRHSKLNCTKWVVLTTVFEPETAVYDFFSLPDWCVVVVGDNKTPHNYLELLAKSTAVQNNIARNTIFLDVATQKQLPYKLVAKLPWNHYSRKNIGYLYAIHHGAQVIYDTDDDNLLIDPEEIPDSSSLFSEIQTFSVKSSVPVALNLYPYFAPVHKDNKTKVESMWPRGFPLDAIITSTSTSLSLIGFGGREPSVIQLLQQHDPDLDAIFRLTQPLPVYFQEPSKMIVVPKNSFAPFNAQSTLWKRSAFWGLYLPMTVTGRVSDIWRSYFMQKVLMNNNMSISYTSAKVRQDRNVHTYLGDFNSEHDLYLKAGELIQYLNKYHTKQGQSSQMKDKSVQVMQEWYEVMVEMWKIDVIQQQDLTLSRLWLEDLNNIIFNWGDSNNTK